MRHLPENHLVNPAKLMAQLRVTLWSSWSALATVLACSILLIAAGCRSHREPSGPSVILIKVPPVGGGPDYLQHISGRVVNAPPRTRVVLYALSKGTWWVQPFEDSSITKLSTGGSWDTVTHLGTDYAALLVDQNFKPRTKLSALPPVGGSVSAVGVMKASTDRIPDAKIIQFSGYNWVVRSSPNSSGGTVCDYEPSNTWVDDQGYLHLLMTQGDGLWHCAGLSLDRSLGYGTYRFVVSDSSHLPQSAVLAIYTQDTDGAEMDIELSRWGKASNRNADYVVQPYYVPENTVHFEIPAGTTTHTLRWEPGTASFTSSAGTAGNSKAVVMEHVFKSGVPVPARERLHFAFYDFQHSQSGLQHPVEIVIQKFEYLP